MRSFTRSSARRYLARFAAVATLCVAAVFAAGSSAAQAATTIHVDGADPGGPGCGTQANPCRTITEGIAAAAAGDTVQVAPGTYTEQLDINKKLDLIGASPANGNPADQTIVASPSPAGTCPSATGVVLCDKLGGGDNRPVIYVHGVTDLNRVNIANLKVAGNGQGTPTFTFYGIAYENAAGTISNVRVSHVRNSPADANDTGYAIYNTNIDLQARHFEVASSDVSDYQEQGITLTDGGLSVNLHNNVAVGNGTSALVVQTGISIGPGVTGTIKDNSVTGHLCYVPNIPSCGPDLLNDEQAAGIRLQDEGAVTVSRTTTPLPAAGATNDVGILDRDSNAARTFAHNVLVASRYAGAFTNDGTLNASRNVLDGDLVGGGNSDAAFVAASQSASHVPTLNLTGNTITKAALGVSLFDDGGVATPSPSLTAHFNRIAANGTAGLSNATAATVNAVNNWWGCNAGPGNSPGCDVVSNTGPGDVDFNPWLVLTATASPRAVVLGERSKIEAKLTTNSDGQTPANNNFQRGVEVTFATNNGTIASPKPTRDQATATSRVKPDHAGSAHVTVTLDSESVHAPSVAALRSGPCANTQTGTSGRDHLRGSLAGDRLLGLGGDDLLRGHRGQDCLIGGSGADRLEGGDQHDVLNGDAGADQLIGGRGRDSFSGGPGDDHINAADGVGGEQINCGGGVDQVRGDPGDIVTNCEVIRH